MAQSSGIRWDKAQLDSALINLPDKMKKVVLMFSETAAIELSAYMKINRPWTDRTGMAKATLNVKCYAEQEGVRMVLAHGVDYGIWLELAHQRRYAIVEPTLRVKGPDVLKNFTGLMEKLGR